MISKIRKKLFSRPIDLTLAKHNILQILPLVVGLLFIDQITKAMVIEEISFFYSKREITSFFNLTLVKNTGVSFGIASHTANANIFFLLLALPLLATIFYLIATCRHRFRLYSYMLIISGGIGNFLDRIRHNGVIDFLDFHYGELHWPSFNLADCYIVLAIIFLLLEDYLSKLMNNKK